MITVTDRIDLGNNEYINLDARYTDPNGNPFSSVSAAQTYHAGKMNELFIGFTVLVKESGWTEAKEYWVQPKGTTPETYGLVGKGAGVTDYNDLDNKPTINNVPVSGNKTASDLGLATEEQGGKADTAVQQITRGGSTLQKTNGVVDIPAEIQEVVATDVAAGGTPTAHLGNGILTLGIPRGADGNNGHNPNLGTYLDTDTLPTTGQDGDYIYVVDTSVTPRTANVYAWNGTAFADTGKSVEDFGLQFASGQAVNGTGIKDLDGDNDPNAAGVLSAEAGKELANVTTEIVASENILNPNSIILNRRIKQDGTEADNNTTTADIVYGCTPYMELPDEGLTLNHGITLIGTSAFGVIIYNSDFVKIGKRNTLSNGGSLFVSPTNYTEEAAQGVEDLTPKYVRFNLYKPEIPYDGTNDGYAIYKGSTLPSSFIPYFSPRREMKQQEIKDGAITTDKIKDGAITVDKIEKTITEFASDNICDPNECYFGNDKYISRNNGNIGSFTSSSIGGYTGFIPIDSRGLSFSPILYSGQGIGGAVYYVDANGNKIFKRSAGSSGIVAYDAGDSSLPETDPLHYPDAFVRFTLRAGASQDNVMVNVGNSILPYTQYLGTRKIISPDILPNSGTNIEKTLQQKKIYTDALKVSMPDKFYAVRGDVLQLFHKGVVYAIDFANRYAMPTCSKGTQYRRYYELDASEVEVVFDVATSSTISVDALYSTQGNTYKVTDVSTKNNIKKVTCLLTDGFTPIANTGSISKVSGDGDSTVAYTGIIYTLPEGEYPYSLTVYDDNRNILGEGSTIIKFVNFPKAPQSTKRILCVGDSLTAGGRWVCEAQRRLLGSGVNPDYPNSPKGNGLDDTKIKFIGSLSKTLYGQTSHFFAKSGWSWEDYATKGRYAIRFYLVGKNRVSIGTKYTNNGHTYEVIELNTIDGVETVRCSTTKEGNIPSPHGENVNGTLSKSSGDGDNTLIYTKSEVDGANPFWDKTLEVPALNFRNYVENICGETGLDMMIIVLGGNAMFTTSLEQQEKYVRAFIGACLSDYPNCKIILVGSHTPSMINMLPGYAVGGNSYGNTYLVKCRLLDIFEMYKAISADYNNVEYESWAGQFDSDYNFPLTQKAVNTRNDSVTEPYAYNTLHPGNAGYMQFADAAYRSIVAHLCQPSE